MRPRIRVPVAGLLLAALVGLPALASCSKGGADQPTPQQSLAAAKKTLDGTAGVHLVLSTDRLPQGVSGLLDADGVATHAPAFKGTIKVDAGGITADAKVIATGGTVYAVLPFSTRYTKINPKDYGAPDPAALMDSKHGLSSLLTAAKHVTAGKQQRDGAQVVRTYSATIPGARVAAIIPSADAGSSFDATFRVGEDDHRLHQVVLTGPFYPQGGDVTYTVAFDKYGLHPHITAP